VRGAIGLPLTSSLTTFPPTHSVGVAGTNLQPPLTVRVVQWGGRVQGASSSTSTLPEEEELWEWLPEELLLTVLDMLLRRQSGAVRLTRWKRRALGAVRGVCRRWRTIHDASCKTLKVRDGMTDEMMHALCGRLPALTILNLTDVKSLTAEGLSAVGGLTALTWLNLTDVKSLTAEGLSTVGGLTSLTWLNLGWNSNVTDVGLQELTSLTKLTNLILRSSFTTKAGWDALKAAIPGLTISPWPHH
jgi:hypothetical protein